MGDPVGVAGPGARRLVQAGVAAAVAAVVMGWAGLTGFAWSDYEYANLKPLTALLAGDWGGFLADPPLEGPSLLMRAPFALSVKLWGGGDLAVYRMVAVPGLAAGAVLALVLFALHLRRFPAARWAPAILLLAAANPVTLRALEIGHPEELFGAAACIGAVLAAIHGRSWPAAVLLGLALANKAWAVLAIGPVLVALEHHRWRTLLVAGAIGAVFVVPFLVGGAGAQAAVTGAGRTDAIFQPWQVWWFLGDADPGHVIRGIFGQVKEDYRAAPGWLMWVSHPLVAVSVVPATIAWWRRHGRGGTGSPDVLLLLALLFLVRCAFDAANNGYYHLPFLLTLLAWEALRRDGPPVLSLVAVSLNWTTFEWLPDRVAPDAQAAFYLLWAVPAMLVLARAVYGRPAAEPAPRLLPAPA